MKFSKKTQIYRITESIYSIWLDNLVVFYGGETSLHKFLLRYYPEDCPFIGMPVEVDANGTPLAYWGEGRDSFLGRSKIEKHKMVEIP